MLIILRIRKLVNWLDNGGLIQKMEQSSMTGKILHGSCNLDSKSKAEIYKPFFLKANEYS